MDEDNKEKIRGLANLSKEEIGKSEEDVKINFIVPLFEALGHIRLKFEHRWKDALVEKLDPSCKLVIETKNYDKDLDRELQQLEKYCHEERPLFGIIANGREVRIFSYFWRSRPTFQKTLTYCIYRKDLKDERVIQTLENTLSTTNLKSGKAKDFIIDREREIENVENKIKEIERESNEKVEQRQSMIDDLYHNVDEIKKQIEGYNSEREQITKETREKISQIWQNVGLPQPPLIVFPYTPEPLKPSGERISIREGESYTGRSIVSFTFRSTRYDVRSWKEMLMKMCEIMLNAHRNKFDHVLNLVGRKSPYFTKNPNEIRSPERISGTDIYVETNLNSKSIVKLSKDILSLFGYAKDDLSIEVR